MLQQFLLGDCLQILPTLDVPVSLTLCDPPYGIRYRSNMGKVRKDKLLNDDTPFTAFLAESYRLTVDGGCLLCFCGWQTSESFRNAISEAGYTVKSQIVWDKTYHGMGDLKGQFAPQHELLWFATKGRFRFPGRRPKSVIRCPKIPPFKMLHPTEKPVALLRDLIEATTVPEAVVLDPCAGVGTTLQAAESCGRSYVGIEIEAKYYEVGVSRLHSGH